MVPRFKKPSCLSLPSVRSKWIVTYAVLILLVLVQNSPAQTVKTVYGFAGGNSGNSAFPVWVALAQGRDGRLYGTTEGISNGSVFGVSTGRLFTDVFDFDHTDGGQAYAGVTLASDGNFYGTTWDGGTGNNGVFFKVTRSGTYTLLHNFAGYEGGIDGNHPVAAPVEASDGNLYGTTEGTTGSTVIPSTIYKYTRAGVFSTIYTFNGTVGLVVHSSLIEGADGYLYGTASEGGINGCGTIFKVSTAGVVLQYYSLTSGTDTGCSPVGPLLQGADGNFYGTTQAGGTYSMGTIFKMSPGFVVSTLYSFQGPPTDGEYPSAGMVQATDGNLYGTASPGSSTYYGALFEVSTGGTYKVLYMFTPTFGDFPLGTLIQHTNGKTYGTLLTDGPGCGCGQVYSLDMGLGQFVTFVRADGKVGQIAQILGQGLTGTTSVTFNGVSATSFVVGSPTYIRAVIPSGASTGPVVVITPKGTLTSNKNFRVIP